MLFTINKKQYNSAPFEFETMCQLEERGIEAEDIGNKKMLSTIRAYFAICSGLPDVLASKEINQHIINGGDLNEIREVIDKEMDKSDFIRAILNRMSDEEVQTEEVSQTVPQIVPQNETKSENTEV